MRHFKHLAFFVLFMIMVLF